MRATSLARALRLAAALVLIFAGVPAATAATISDPGQGPVTLDPGATGAAELGGIAWAGGDSWLVVSDDVSAGPRAFGATIMIDPATGTVTGSPTVDSTLMLATSGDPEGIAFDPGATTIVVADEVGPAIRRFDAVTGTLVATATIPAVFTAGLRSNLGFESAAVDRHGAVWTANEEALTGDGAVSSFTDGTIVRIQRFSGGLEPDGQWGYVTDPITADVLGSNPGRDVERSGVSELLVLADGSLVALERMLGGGPPPGFPVLRIRLYAVDLAAADDTSAIPSLTVGSFAAAAKTLLWEATFNALSEPFNLEGMGLGPDLGDGQRSLLLVADDAAIGGGAQALYPLIITLPPLLSDGFESGDTGAWSSTTP